MDPKRQQYWVYGGCSRVPISGDRQHIISFWNNCYCSCHYLQLSVLFPTMAFQVHSGFSAGSCINGIITTKIKKVWKQNINVYSYALSRIYCGILGITWVSQYTFSLMAHSFRLSSSSMARFSKVCASEISRARWDDILSACHSIVKPCTIPLTFVYISFLGMAINTWNMCVILLILHVNLASCVLRGKDVLSAALMQKGKWIWQEFSHKLYESGYTA